MTTIDPVQSIGPVRPSSPFPFETDTPAKTDETFAQMLQRAVGTTNDMMTHADEMAFKLALGEVEDIHQVMIAIEKASIAMSLTLEIRDRAVEAFNTLMRTAV
ncbi:MAG TPA: flagellar hook-basal body complex protein FliE [bacterium]|nr:MAG: flagellar hook-basal body protein FliE [bacterium ADurb.Bin236]HOC91660.1 flagellar hook-basal body complex protein FliE [bacterium]HOY64863.1 flagellar hook-basal body complex protein FliE [bacterium]HPI76595.1 flagellar hook-basal body complex protein FliE [bacterium]HPN94212.1 flagellar hook-basal body complex protein FliE [bacterium]